MGVRRWLRAALPALLVLLVQTLCQDEREFFFGPVERSFAQVQPHVFPNSRQQAYYDQTDVTPQYKYATSNQAGLPSPNYNQNPSPFQLPTGRSQPSGQFYLNQEDYITAQKSRFRPAVPSNFQFVPVHTASTYRPDSSLIHSVAYQHNPSKPEMFLGQITINNPDTDFLPANRFKNSQFDGNSLRNSNFKFNPLDDDAGGSNDDLFRDHRVTTYNPSRLNNKHKQVLRQDSIPTPESTIFDDSEFDEDVRSKTFPPQNIPKNSMFKATTYRIPATIVQSPGTLRVHPASTTTEYISAYNLGSLLESDVESGSVGDTLKQTSKDSDNVKIIKSHLGSTDDRVSSDFDTHDSNPSASSMNSGNVSKPLTSDTVVMRSEPKFIRKEETTTNRNEDYDFDSTNKTENLIKPTIAKIKQSQDTESLLYSKNSNEKETEEPEYEDYEDYETEEMSEPTHSSEISDNIENEYTDEIEEHVPDQSDETTTTKISTTPNTENKSLITSIESQSLPSKTFEIVTLKPNNTMVKDDNFKEFKDMTLMDHDNLSESQEEKTTKPFFDDDFSEDTSKILRQEIVSVVTTKSVVNGTISIPDVTLPPLSTIKFDQMSKKNDSEPSVSTTTENWVIASVQTSRSVSGARFLPFPTIDQEEKKQVLTDQSYENDEMSVTDGPGKEIANLQNNTKDKSSTESLNDKLDSIQSELSSSVLSGSYKNNDKNFAVITESLTEIEHTSSSPQPLQLFTVRTITTPSTTEKSAPEPLPVTIKKFGQNPRPSTTTTEKPKRKSSYVTVQVDDLKAFLPAGYKPRTSYKDRKKISTTTSQTTSTTLTTPSSPTLDNAINGTQGRSSGITNKNKVVIHEDSSTVLHKDTKLTKEKPIQLEDIFSSFKSEDVSKFLPPGFKLSTSSTTELPKKSKSVIENIFEKVPPLDVSAFLPKDYPKSSSATTVRPKTSKFTTVADKVDIAAFLPKGFKLDQSKNDDKDVIKKVQITDLSNLVPPGFNVSKVTTEKAGPEIEKENITNSSDKPSNGFKVVFPSRPGNKPTRKSTTTKPIGGIGPVTLMPTIQKGWPTRASTEFTGWPSPSTTPFSIDKLLEAQRNATATSPSPALSTEATTRRTTTTTTTTQPPPPPTTPGVCRRDCDIAGTIKIVSGVEWIPELLDHHTHEWKKLAEEVKDELNSVYSKSDMLKKWYKGIRIDAFSKGSVLVDYFVELHDVGDKIDTAELKQLFHKSLHEAKAGSVVEKVIIPREEKPFDLNMMVGDQPEEERVEVTKSVDKSAGKLEVGKFVVDPAFTEFIVLPKRPEPAVSKAEEEAFLPQWGIAVIVIALASLLFVIIFGVTVLVNRQKSAKAKQPIPLSEDMLRELDKSHMGGYDDLHLKERELPYPPSKQRRLSATLVDPMTYPGAAGDSWRSEWTPQLQQYMQHYTPDSGRGSQIYGPAGNPYGYGGGSQLYGQTGGAGSMYGYSGEYPPHPRSQYSRRRSEYDANF